MARFERGFTLIEILVVLALIALATGTVLLTIQNRDNQKFVLEHSRGLLQKMRFIQEEMIFRPDPIGIFFYEGGYRFFKAYIRPPKKDDPFETIKDRIEWRGYSDRLLKGTSFPKELRVLLYVDASPVVLDALDKLPEKIQPQITFVPDTDAIPFEITMSLDEEITYALVRHPSGKMELNKQ